jgi:pseudaminic acid synthase
VEFKIGDRYIGDNHPVFIVAEMSCNHLQEYENAVEIIKEAKKAGADAIKLQTYTPDTMTIDCDNKYFTLDDTIWEGKNLYELYKEAYTPWEWQPKLKVIAENEGLIFFSTPFDKSAVDFLEELSVPVYKIASYEITDIPLIEYIASKRKPVIFSTGMATLTDIELAISTIKKQKNENIAVLKCVSAYPTPIEQTNLKTLANIRETFSVISGLSDHTKTITTSVLAVAYDAKIIEKHLTLDRSLGGPDAPFSLEPNEFKKMVESVREAEKAIGKVTYELTEKQKRSREMARSLFAVKDIKKGEKFTEENVRSIRPGYGLHPKYKSKIIGEKASYNISKGSPILWEMIKK